MGYTFSFFREEAMPWKECSVMDERLQFVARRLAGEPLAELCREFGISRKTGYKIFDRYQQCGVQGLTDRSRRPYRYAHQLPFQVENFILNVKQEHPSWGARKIRERLIRRFSGIPIPANSTIHAVLDRHNLVERRGRLRRRVLIRPSDPFVALRSSPLPQQPAGMSLRHLIVLQGMPDRATSPLRA
jgi:transposase